MTPVGLTSAPAQQPLIITNIGNDKTGSRHGYLKCHFGDSSPMDLMQALSPCLMVSTPGFTSFAPAFARPPLDLRKSIFHSS
jgi:hypothetical protein